MRTKGWEVRVSCVGSVCCVRVGGEGVLCGDRGKRVLGSADTGGSCACIKSA